MGTRSRILIVCIALVTACGNASRPVLLPEPASAPADIRAACDRAAVRCSSCHTLERVTASHRRGRADWELQVKRMRLMPASGISVEDADVIVKCLVYRDEMHPGP